MSRYLVGSKPVQDDFEATTAGIGNQYDALLSSYFTDGKPVPGAIADLRAFRKETRRIGRRYAGRVGAYLERIRTVAAVLYLEARRVHDPDEVGFTSVQNFWSSALQGGPMHVQDADGLAGWLRTEGASEALVRFQCAPLFELLEARDSIIAEALPVEYRRIACETILWKLAHGHEVEAWSVEDEAAVEEGLKRGRGNPDMLPISEEKQAAIYERADILLAEDGNSYEPKKEGALVSSKLSKQIEVDLDIPESTVRRYLEKKARAQE